jgi:putative ABC transport system permease protein
VNHQAVTPEYFRAMGIPLLAGRLLEHEDGEAPVTVINQTMARGFWPGESPLGKRVQVGAPRPGAPWLTIAGIVGDVHNTSLDVTPLPQMYELHRRAAIPSMWLAIRTPAQPGLLLPAVRQIVAHADPEQPVYDIQTMENRVAGSLAQPRFQGVLSGFFAAVALLLSTVGAYGVLANWARSRTQEVGIRIALGAAAPDVQWLVLRQGMLPVVLGAAGGMLAAAASAPLLREMVYGVGARDPFSQAGALLVVALSAAAACWIPARRAARIDPAACLRSE